MALTEQNTAAANAPGNLPQHPTREHEVRLATTLSLILKSKTSHLTAPFNCAFVAAEEGRASTPGGARRAQVTGLLTNLPKWLQILSGSCRWQGCLLFIWPSRCIYETYVKVCVCVCVDVCVSCASATVLRMLLMLAPDRPSTFK